MRPAIKAMRIRGISVSARDWRANTSSAGSIIAFHKYQDDLPAGAIGVICSFGAGYSIGCVVLRKR